MMWADKGFTECYVGISGKEGFQMPKVGQKHANGFMDFVDMKVTWHVVLYNYT